MGYYYDLHCHTAEGSACADFPVREMVRFYKERGYDGFVLADDPFVEFGIKGQQLFPFTLNQS